MAEQKEESVVREMGDLNIRRDNGSSRAALERKAKKGWRMFYTMVERNEVLSRQMVAQRELVDRIKNEQDIDLTYLKSQFVELYDKVHSQIECPSCFELLTKENLDVPNCGHLLCKTCKNKICETNCQCPICRKKFYVADL